jgi:hypothetical protein
MTDDTKPRTVTVLEDLRDINRANDILRNQIRVAKEARGRTEKWIIPIEAEARVAISKMRDEEGKKLYSNDPTRDAAVEELLNGPDQRSKDYQEGKKIIDELDIEINIDKNLIEKNLGEWKVLELLTAQLTASANRAVVDAIGDI